MTGSARNRLRLLPIQTSVLDAASFGPCRLLQVRVRVPAVQPRYVDLRPRRRRRRAVAPVRRASTETRGSCRGRGRRRGRTDGGAVRAGGARVRERGGRDADRRRTGLPLRAPVPARQGTALPMADTLPGGVEHGDCRQRRRRQDLETDCRRRPDATVSTLFI